MDLLRSLLDLVQQKPRKLGSAQQKSRTKVSRSRRAGAAKAPAKSGSLPDKGKGKSKGKDKRELTAAQAVREAELRG